MCKEIVLITNFGRVFYFDLKFARYDISKELREGEVIVSSFLIK